jgi:hypothetical protein
MVEFSVTGLLDRDKFQTFFTEVLYKHGGLPQDIVDQLVAWSYRSFNSCVLSHKGESRDEACKFAQSIRTMCSGVRFITAEEIGDQPAPPAENSQPNDEDAERQALLARLVTEREFEFWSEVLEELENSHIKTIGELMQKSAENLRLLGFSDLDIAEIRQKLFNFGLKLNGDY